MSPGQRAFHEDPSRLRWLIAGTQVGKTRASAAETWWHSGGDHPYRKVIAAPNEGWLMVPNMDTDWPKLCEKLHEIEPFNALHHRCRYDKARGYRYGSDRMVVRANGSVIRPRSGTQDLQTLEGASLAWIGIDEVPKEGHWFAILQRITALHGAAWASFTPVGRAVDWLKRYFEGDVELGIEPAPGWSKHKIKLTPRNVPHRPPAWVEDQIALMDPWEIPQRRDAEWDGPAPGRRFPAFRPDLVIDEDVLFSLRFDYFRLGLDHGEGLNKQQVKLLGFAGKRIVLVWEWGNATNDCTATEIAAAIRKGLDRYELTLHHLQRIVGDINTAGLAAPGSGVKFNLFVQHALAKNYGLRQLPQDIDIPIKGPGSVRAGESALNTEMKEGMFLVFRECTGFIKAAKAYTGKEQDLKDHIDPVRYACDDIILDPHRRIPEPTPPMVTL